MIIIYWKGKNFWPGKLLEHPEIIMQGETLDELEENIKYKLLSCIWEKIFFNFDKVVDLFGGTASVSHIMKTNGKFITYNDLLKSNYIAGLALIENCGKRISKLRLNNILEREDDNQLDIISKIFLKKLNQ